MMRINGYDNISKREFKKRLQKNELVKLTKYTNDVGLKLAYADYIDFETGFSNIDLMAIIPFDKFCNEIKKGYGKTNYIQISRLFIIKHGCLKGVYYDNEYCE